EWSWSGADHPLHAVEVIQQVVFTKGDPGQKVVVTTEIFGGGVDHDVDAQIQGLDVIRGSQSCINNSHHLTLLGHLYNRRQVHHAQIRVGRGFGKDYVGVGLDRFGDGLRSRVHQ